VARAARYPAPLLDSVSPERKRRFFVADGGSYVVSKDVRDLCIFSPHSVLRDPPFSRIDLVSCRNLLIYFGPEAQEQVIPVFHYALRPEGHLFLGTSENIGAYGDLFTQVDKKQRIFRRRSDGTHGLRLPPVVSGLRLARPMAAMTPRTTLGGLALRQAIEGQVLERFAPAFVVVNREGEIAYYSARTGRYLEAAAGVPSRQVMAAARKGLRLDLRTALREAIETGATATRQGIAVEGEDGRIQPVTLTVEPLRDRDREEPLYFVLFTDEGPSLSRDEAPGRMRVQDNHAVHLERELRETRERLQSLVEEYETALEELKSSNEELVSVNEELQSTNEEMEASKEELQAVNEELHTVNGELNSKIDALDRANADMQNLLDSTDVATIFLDDKLVIRSFTPAVAKVFNILPTDRGRPITDLASRASLPDLAQDVITVLDGGEAIERRAHLPSDGTHFLVRISPYRSGKGRTQGVVLSFVDVTSLTHAEGQQAVLIAELHHRTRNLLTVVQAIASLTLGRGGTMKSFAERLASLGRAQELLAQGGRDELDLGEIIRVELHAHPAAADGRVTVCGPAVPLGPSRVQAVALAVHELATNAVKYGALKQADGRLAVTWRLEPDSEGSLYAVLTWQESGCVMPAAPPGRGYGRHLIERALFATLGTKAELTFGTDGIACRITIPLGARPARALSEISL